MTTSPTRRTFTLPTVATPDSAMAQGEGIVPSTQELVMIPLKPHGMAPHYLLPAYYVFILLSSPHHATMQRHRWNGLVPAVACLATRRAAHHGPVPGGMPARYRATVCCSLSGLPPQGRTVTGCQVHRVSYVGNQRYPLFNFPVV